MSYAVTYDVPLDEDQYRKVIDSLGSAAMAGQLSHLVVRLPAGGLRITDVWESPEAHRRALTERILPAVEEVTGEAPRADLQPEELPVIGLSTPLQSPTFTVWRDAPVRTQPFVSRSSEYLTDESDDPSNTNIVDWIRADPGAPHRRWDAYGQCRGSRIDAISSGKPIWNDYWLYTAGQNDQGGWISMVDVTEGGNGEKKVDVPVTAYDWTPSNWHFKTKP